MDFVKLSTLQTARQGKEIAKVNGRSLLVEVYNLSEHPQAKSLRRKASQAMMEEAQKKGGMTLGRMMSSFSDSEKQQSQLFNHAILGWEMTEKDLAYIEIDEQKALAGIEKPVRVKLGDGAAVNIQVKVRSSAHPQIREKFHALQKKAAANKGMDEMLPDDEEIKKTNVEKAMEVLVDWNLSLDGEEKAAINPDTLGDLPTDVLRDILSASDEDEDFCKAKSLSAQELEDLDKKTFEFNQENIDRLCKTAVSFRDEVIALADDQATFRSAAKQAEEHAKN